MIEWPDVIYDQRWICYACGDLAHLDHKGLCRQCAPEKVAELGEIAMRALAGEPMRVDKAWRIG